MNAIIVFEVVQLLASVYAWRRGGCPERVVAAMLLTAAALSIAAGHPTEQYRRVFTQVFGVDLLLLTGLFLVAARANRFWPMWIAAMQLLAVAVHFARAVDPTVVPQIYFWFSNWIAYPICAAMVIGTSHYRRRWRLQAQQPRDWSPFRW